jgi:hypothetical protein
MANYTNIQLLQDGPRNVIIKLTGILDTSDVAAATLLDPAALSVIGQNEGLATRLAIKHIKYNIEDTLAVYLYWEATADVLILPLEGRGNLPFETALTNTEAAGVTGKLKWATQGWAVSGVVSFALEIQLKKYQK